MGKHATGMAIQPAAVGQGAPVLAHLKPIANSDDRLMAICIEPIWPPRPREICAAINGDLREAREHLISLTVHSLLRPGFYLGQVNSTSRGRTNFLSYPLPLMNFTVMR